MRRKFPFIAPLATVIIVATAQIGLALDPGATVGVSGKSGPAVVSAGKGQTVDLGAARPGFSSRIGHGSIGVHLEGIKGGLNPGSDSGFHAAGLGKIRTAGIGGSTMDTVPGRTPTYINIVSGTRGEPYVGSRGP